MNKCQIKSRMDTGSIAINSQNIRAKRNGTFSPSAVGIHRR